MARGDGPEPSCVQTVKTRLAAGFTWLGCAFKTKLWRGTFGRAETAIRGTATYRAFVRSPADGPRTVHDLRLTRCRFVAVLVAALCANQTFAQLPNASSAPDLAAALAAYSNADYERAFDEAAPLSDIGMAEAQHLLARVHLKPEFAGYDVHEAARLMELSASQGLPLAQHDLGEMYRLGLGLTPDSLTAFSWHLRAARQRLRSSEIKISEMYASGQGVKRNETQARKWAARAERDDGQGTVVKRRPKASAAYSAATSKPVTVKLQRAPSHRYRVQLGAYRGRETAEKAKNRIASALPDQSVKRFALVVASADRGDGKGLRHRIQAGPVADLATARFICDQVTQRLPDQGCFTIQIR